MKEIIEKLKAGVAELEQAWVAMEEVRDAKVEEAPVEETPVEMPVGIPGEIGVPGVPVDEVPAEVVADLPADN